MQEMEHFEAILPDGNCEKYIRQGYFTVRGSNRWSDSWTDMMTVLNKSPETTH